MDFYTVSYVESQITSGHTLGFVIFVVVLLALLGVGIQVLRNGFTSRYRDLTVILSLIIVFFLGLEYQEYGRMKNYSEDSSRMAQFLHSFSADRGVDEGQFFQIVTGYEEYEFKKGSVLQLINPDINQEIYGVPEYLAALQSAFLNESATLFRRKYYLNGAHAGSIIYMTDPTQNQDDIEAIKTQIRQTKGTGNFKNLFVYIPNGKKDGMQVIPLSDAVAKDDFLNIKNASRDDVLAAHRVPPQLMGIVPNNTGGFGDVEKATRVFFINEIIPLQERLKEINSWVGEEVITFSDYKLLKELFLSYIVLVAPQCIISNQSI